VEAPEKTNELGLRICPSMGKGERERGGGGKDESGVPSSACTECGVPEGTPVGQKRERRKKEDQRV